MLAGAFLASAGWAGGFKIQDQSTRAMGMIDAFVAGADDASAVYYNPAGITRLARPQWIGNVYGAYGVTRYRGNGHSEHSDNRHYVLPTFFLAGPVSGVPRLALGLGVYCPFGLGSRWPEDIRMRYGSTLGEIALVDINPTAAWKVSDKLSLGLGVDVFTSTVKSRHMVDYSPYGGGDGLAKLDGHGRGLGYNFGLQYQWSDTIAFGLTYRSPVHVGYDGNVHYHDVPTPLGLANLSLPADARMDYPASIAAAVSWQSTKKLRLEFAAEWTHWRTRDSQSISVHGPPQFQPPPSQLDWNNSWVLMVGAEYQLDERWTLRWGYGYNQTPAPAATSDPSLPAGDTHAIAFGAGYRIARNIRVDGACVMAYARRRELHGPQATAQGYAGRYDALSIYFALGLTWDF